MDKPYTHDAARLLMPRVMKAGGQTEWPTFVDLIASAVKVLIQGCAPTPSQGIRYVAWKPLIPGDVFGRQARHRAKINVAMAAQWSGPPEQLPDVLADMWDAVDRGELTHELMKNLYRENQD